MKNIINPSIRTMAAKLCSGIVTPSQCTRILSAWRSGSRIMNLHALKHRAHAPLLFGAMLKWMKLGVSSNASAQLAVNLGADQTVLLGATVTITADVTGTSTPDASLTAAWEVPHDSQARVFSDLGGIRSQALRRLFIDNTNLILSFTAPTEKNTAATTVNIPIEITVTDPNAAEGQGPVTDVVIISVDYNPLRPTFADDASIANQNYFTDMAIESLTLPAATSGNGTLTYTLTPAIPGLSLNSLTGILTGTPTVAAMATEYIYIAADSDGNIAESDTDRLMFTITVRTLATGFTLSLEDNNGAVTERREGTGVSALATLTPTPAGSAFAANQMVTLTATPPLASRPTSATDPYVPYTAVTPFTLAFTANTPATPNTSFNLTTQNDLFDHADFPVVFTATATPSNITATTTVTLIDNDISITTTTATSVATGATVTYDVQLSEAPPANTIVTVASQGTETATVSPATLTFSTSNWNMAQTVTVTGVAIGSTTIRHSAPPTSRFDYVTNDVEVTVTAPATVAPVFTGDFTSPIEAAENQTAVGAADYFGASDTSTGGLTLGGTDVGFFTLSPTGTLTFNDAPNFEMPRGMAFDASSNTNDYALTVAATNSAGTTMSGAITVSVTNVNDLPVLAAFTLPTFTEYSEGTYTFTATDEDQPAQTLSFSLAANAVGATMTNDGVFTWMPREADGEVERAFTVNVTDNIGTTPTSVSTDFTITAAELANRAPTGAAITAATTVTVPNTLTLLAAATDPDTGDMLTYTWAITTEGGSIAPMTGASVTYTPPTVTTTKTITVTVTVSDDATPPLTTTATHTITVNPPVAAGTAPAFTNMAMFTTPIEAAENQTAVGAPNFFAAPGSGTVNLTLGGTDATRFAITAGGTLTFVAAPDFEMPRGMALSGTNTNNYALTVTATNSDGSAASGAITVTVTDVNEVPPVLATIPTPTFTEHTAGGFTITATDGDSGQMLTFTLTGETHGATIATGGGFSWTPGEDDGGVERMFTVTVTDDGTPPMSASTTFAITATEAPNRAPTFGSATIDDQTYMQGTEITSLTLPEATGGDGTITYTLTPAPPAGLSFDAATRDFTGTPTTVATAADYTYTATDAETTWRPTMPPR